MARTSPTQGVHDHGFNNISTYGNLLRLMKEGRIADDAWERSFYELALKFSGAVQAHALVADGRWRRLHLFLQRPAFAVRRYHPLPAHLAVAHRLGHVLMGENDRRISLLDRLIDHARATARYAVYYGEGRDVYDARGRTAHESIFNRHRRPLTVVRARNRAIRHSPPGRAASPGRCADLRNSSNFSRRFRRQRSAPLGGPRRY